MKGIAIPASFAILTTIVKLGILLPYDSLILDLIVVPDSYLSLVGMPSRFMDLSIFTVISLIALSYSIYKRGPDGWSISFILGAFLTVLLTALLKSLIAMPRPEAYCEGSLRLDSYPSGHASRASFFHFMVSKRYGGLTPFTLSLLLSVSLSRILLHAHYPSDVIGGVMIGYITAKWIGMAIDALPDLCRPPRAHRQRGEGSR